MKLGILQISDCETKSIIQEMNLESEVLNMTIELDELLTSIKENKKNLLKVSNKEEFVII